MAEDKVQALFKEMVENYREELQDIIDTCQSPIEQLMGLWLYRMARRHELPGFYLCPQADDIVPPYRLDFVLTTMDSRHSEIAEVVVECDGHDFHEKTKAQVARDKKRDRAIAAAGYHVLHFTGSEIWRNPEGCAREVIRFLQAELIKQGKKGNREGVEE